MKGELNYSKPTLTVHSQTPQTPPPLGRGHLQFFKPRIPQTEILATGLQYRNVTDGRTDEQTALHCEQCGRAVKKINLRRKGVDKKIAARDHGTPATVQIILHVTISDETEIKQF